VDRNEALLALSKSTPKAYQDKLGEEGGGERFTQPHIASPDVFDQPNLRKLKMTFHGVVEGSLQMTKYALSTTEPISVLEPELGWEGGHLEIASSVRGEVEQTVRELRDPYLYEEDGKI